MRMAFQKTAVLVVQSVKAPEKLVTDHRDHSVVLGPEGSTARADGHLEDVKERNGGLSPALVCDKAV